MREGCKEKVNLNFLKWIWKYPKQQKPKILGKINQLSSDKNVFILKNSKEISQFLQKI